MEATESQNRMMGDRAEPATPVSKLNDGQWCPRDLGMRIVLAAREAAAMHIEAQIREEVAVERTQAASLALLARRARMNEGVAS